MSQWIRVDVVVFAGHSSMHVEKHGPTAAVVFLAGWKFSEFWQCCVSGSQTPSSFRSLSHESSQEDCSKELRKIIELQAVKSELEYRVQVLLGLNLSFLFLIIIVLVWLTRCCSCCMNRTSSLAQNSMMSRLPPPSALALPAPDSQGLDATAFALASLGGVLGAANQVVSPSSKAAAVWRRG